MIYQAIGDVGAGKSSYLVERVLLPALAQGREVWTNLRLTDNPLTKAANYFADFLAVIPDVTVAGDYRPRPGAIPPGALVIVDEAGLALMSGLGEATNSPAMKNAYVRMRAYLAQHRHFCDAKGRSTDIFFAAQCSSQITAQVRNLTSYTIYLRSFKGLIGLKRGSEYRLFAGSPSRADIQMRGASRGGGYSTLSRGIFYPKKTTFDLYRSYDTPDAIGGMESMHVKPVLSFRLWMLGATFIFLALCMYFVLQQLYGIFNLDDGFDTQVPPPEVHAPPPERLRLGGYSSYGGVTRACWLDANGRAVVCDTI